MQIKMRSDSDTCTSIEKVLIDEWVNSFFHSFKGMKEQVTEEHINLFLKSLEDKIDIGIEKGHDPTLLLEDILEKTSSYLSELEKVLNTSIENIRRMINEL